MGSWGLYEPRGMSWTNTQLLQAGRASGSVPCADLGLSHRLSLQGEADTGLLIAVMTVPSAPCGLCLERGNVSFTTS